jgi:hypothetical protein
MNALNMFASGFAFCASINSLINGRIINGTLLMLLGAVNLVIGLM